MHIPFSKDKGVQERHVIDLVDNSEQGGGLPTETILEEPRSLPRLRPKLTDALENRVHPPIQQLATAGDAFVDVLYENQRGSFLCGMPLFSAAGLWVCDPNGWTSFDHRFSPFNIFNATLPDPTWEWVWKRWFVDMSGDVDENGWTYNINFTRHHWHGHHMWYHAFVRRRRWLRKRRKKVTAHRVGQQQRDLVSDNSTMYSSMYGVNRPSSRLGGKKDVSKNNDDSDEEYVELENFGEFFAALRSARLDREKLDAVDNFLRHGKELSALAGEMKHILQFMIFQESRCQLLALLAQRCQEMEKHHSETKDEEYAERHQCVLDAIDMADTLISKLDYFSDRTRLTAVEEELELDRILAARLEDRRSQRRPSDSLTKPVEKLTNFRPVPLSQTMRASKKDFSQVYEAEKDGDEDEKDEDSGSDTTTRAGDNQPSRAFTRAEKGKGREK